LDNCEHLLSACAELCETLLPGSPQVRVLTTSREAMRARGETVWPVPSLRPSEASQLFIERARSSRADLRFEADDVMRVGEACRKLDYIPLAIELAAARVRALGLDEVTAHLDERLRVLSVGNRNDSPRHQTLRAAIDWSHDLLTSAEKILFRRMSVF